MSDQILPGFFIFNIYAPNAATDGLGLCLRSGLCRSSTISPPAYWIRVCLSTRRLKHITHTQAVVFTPSVMPLNVPINSVSHLISPCCLMEQLWWKPDDFSVSSFFHNSERLRETWTHLPVWCQLAGCLLLALHLWGWRANLFPWCSGKQCMVFPFWGGLSVHLISTFWYTFCRTWSC